MSRTDDMEVSMPTRRTRGPLSNPHGIIGLVALVLAITGSAALAGSSRSAREPERIFVTAVGGAVSVTMAGASTPVQLDSTVDLPARIVTGDDGMLSLTQAGTNITIAADSDVEIPAEAADGQLIARLVQRRGNVFYDVAHREAGTLRVETPFLVAVIKGTQFNVAVEDGASTISLFQGRLEIDTPDGSDSVHINAGQIATRGRASNAINVIGMNDVRLVVPRASDTVARADALQPRVFVPTSVAQGPRAGTEQARVESAIVGTDVGAGSDVDLGAAASPGRGLHVGIGSPGVGAGGVPAALGVSGGLGVGGAPASLGVSAGLGAGGVPASLGVSAGLGAGGVPASLGVSAGLGAGSVPASLGVNLNASSPGVGAGGVPAALGVGGGLGAGGVPAAIGVSGGLGTGGVPAVIDANLGVGSGSPGASLGTGAGVGVGVSLGSANVGGSVNVDVGLGNNGLHLGTGGSAGSNPGLHLGNGSGNPAPPGKSNGHP
jgi:hypothetical protein